MSDKNVAESTTGSYELGKQWRRKGNFWNLCAYTTAGVLFGNFMSLLVIDRVFPWPLTLALMCVALGALARATYCFRRARKAVSS